jgi:hypothetical protein
MKKGIVRGFYWVWTSVGCWFSWIWWWTRYPDSWKPRFVRLVFLEFWEFVEPRRWLVCWEFVSNCLLSRCCASLSIEQFYYPMFFASWLILIIYYILTYVHIKLTFMGSVISLVGYGLTSLTMLKYQNSLFEFDYILKYYDSYTIHHMYK